MGVDSLFTALMMALISSVSVKLMVKAFAVHCGADGS